MSTTAAFSVQSRDYTLVTPGAVSNVPKPLLVVLHGGMGNASMIESATGFTQLAEAKSFYVAYPEGTAQGPGPLATKRCWNAGVCCGKAVALVVDDVAWLSDVIHDAQVRAGYNKIDPKRVYVTGMSNGAMMAYRMAVEAPELIAAVVIVSGTLAIDNASGAQHVPVLHIHGEMDDNVPWLGGVAGPSGVDHKPVPESSGPNSTMSLLLTPRGEVTTDHDPQADVETWIHTCDEGAPVELKLIRQGVHTWPGAVADPLQALDASALCIDFCARFRK